jgi:8-hydroxy-5-deazaflavin:NADPH oxidoreductase
MRIGVLGTGIVGRTLATKLVELGHDVKMGSRQAGNPHAREWVAGAGERASEGSFSDAAAFGELVLNATSGEASIDALTAAGEANLDGKLLVDVSNPIDRASGFPPALTVCNTDSIAEQIQRAFPNTRVVKTLNTVTAMVMVNPALLAGDHMVFVSGNEPAAKQQVAEMLESFGWPSQDIVDLGDISTARGPEAYLLLWLRLWNKAGTGLFNIALVRQPASSR